MHASAQPGLNVYSGGRQCRRVRFEVAAPVSSDMPECTCSICRATGFLHLIVPASRSRLLSGAEFVTEYNLNTGTAKCPLCRTRA